MKVVSDMMAIQATGLTKVYPLYRSSHDRLKEALHPRRKKYHKEFFALRGVSLEVGRGEVMGVVGRNGSGKSTLLKILSRVLTPTRGSFTLRGSVSSLLELGSGFNPDLTGIENIFFYGTILGFSNEKMRASLDSILAFADIGEFVHQPLKTYSSGMKARLAFAVAIHVDPEVLILDEVLAVGDIRFQQKCFREIEAFKKRGKTILFCSHSPEAILNICDSCLWLDEGEVRMRGDAEAVMKEYLAWNYYAAEVKPAEVSRAAPGGATMPPSGKDVVWQDVAGFSWFGDGAAEILAAALYDENQQPIQQLRGGERVFLAFKTRFNRQIDRLIYGFTIKNRLGAKVCATNSLVEGKELTEGGQGEEQEVVFMFKMPHLGNGSYTIDIAVASGSQEDHVQHCWKYDALVFQMASPSPKAQFGYLYLPEGEVQVRIS